MITDKTDNASGKDRKFFTAASKGIEILDHP
jgi:hypothetical protein